jgi:HK97 family phage portal protein
VGARSWLTAAFGRRQKSAAAGGAALTTQGWLPTLGATPSASGMLISQATAMSVSTVYACVTIRAQDVSRCTPRLFRRDARGQRVQVKPDDRLKSRPKAPAVAGLFVKPNRAQTWFEWMEQQSVAHLLRGNAYAPVRRDSRGQPVELVPVNPDAVLVLEAADGGIFYNVNRIGLWQLAMLRDFPQAIAAEDMLHLRGLSFNSLMGLSTIGAARDAIGLAMGQEQQASRWMSNGARPSFALLVKTRLTESAGKRLKQQFNDVAQGVNNTGNTVILEEGIEPKPLQLTAADLAFLEQRQFSVPEIARFWRVPPHKLGAELMRGINVDQVNQDYVNNTVMPDLHRWEQKFADYFGLGEQELEVDMDETVLLRADITARYNAGRIGILTSMMTPNEFRAGEGLPPKPGGDDLLRPVNMASAGSDITGAAGDGAGRPAAGEGPHMPAADATQGAKPASEDEDDE